MAKQNVGGLATEKYRELPIGGWKPHRVYEVKVAWSRNNPIYRALLYTGFIQDGKPAGGHTMVWAPGHEGYGSHPDDLWYLEIVRDLGLDFSLEGQRRFKDIDEQTT